MTINVLNKAAINNLNPVYCSKQHLRQSSFSSKADNDTFESSGKLIQNRLAQKLSETADGYLRKGEDQQAKVYYEKAIKTKPDFSNPYYGLAKIYKNADQTQQAIETYQELLKQCPEELEAQTLMGHCYKKIGDFDKAKDAFEKASEKDPKYDYAVRSLKEINNLILAKTEPALAEQQREKQTDETLKKALAMVIDSSPRTVTDKIRDINYSFGKTDSLSGHPNIAQYEDNKRKIVITEEYRWAAPEVVAAYLAHENIHGSDQDGFTSVYEEQDAYDASVKFWVKNKNGIKDPELDYAAQLYNQNPQTLRNKVADIYRSRDKNIPEYSPSHPPGIVTGNAGVSALQKLGNKLAALFGFKS